MRGPYLALVAVGGATGCLVRFAIDLLTGWEILNKPAFPWPTFGINVLGCLIIGLLGTLFVGRAHEERWRALVIVGFLGGFTTYSAFAMETVVLLDEGLVVTALAYLVGTLLVGALAVRLGVRVAHRISGHAVGGHAVDGPAVGGHAIDWDGIDGR